MRCANCSKRWYCFAACPSVNYQLVRSLENLEARRKLFTIPWTTR